MTCPALCLAALLGPLALAPQTGGQEPTELPPRGVLPLDLSEGRTADFRWTAEAAGTLFLNALSDEVDPWLSVSTTAGELLAKNEDRGEGVAAFVRLVVEPDDELLVRVGAVGDGRLLLRWTPSPETEATLAASDRADVVLGRLPALAAAGEVAAARRLMLDTAHDLVAAEGSAESARVHSRLYRLLGPALQLGAREAASIAIERNVVFFELRLPPTNGSRLRVLNAAAMLHNERGDYAAARDVLEHVLAVMERHWDPDDPEIPRLRTNLAVVRIFLGDVAGARDLAEQAVLALEEAGNDAQLIPSRGVLVGALMRGGEIDEALAVAEQVVAACEGRPPGDHLSVSARTVLALVLREAGELDRAQELLVRILEEYEGHAPRSESYRSEAYFELAKLELERGELEACLELLDLVEAELASRPVGDHAWEAVVVATRARALARAGRGEELAVALERLASAISSQAAMLAEVQSPRELDEALSGDVFSGAVDTLLQLGAPDRRVFELIESLRGVGLSTARRLRSARAVPAIAAGLEVLRSAHEAVADAGSSPDGLEGAVRARDAAQRELLAAVHENLGDRAWELEVDARALAAALPSDAALVTFRRWNGPEGGRFVAFVLGRGEPLRRVDLGPADALDAAISDWRGAVIEAREPAQVRAGGERLRALVIDPLGLELEALTRLIAVPDDSLHLVPLDALPTAQREFLGDRVALELRSSLRELQDLAEVRSVERRLVAFGGIDYGAESPDAVALANGPVRSARWNDDAPFVALPATGREAQRVAELFRRTFGDDAAVETYRGPEASRAALVDAAGRASALHLSTHGFFGRSAEGVDLALLRSAGLGDVRLSPLLSSGLALSGANLAPNAFGRRPGLVSAEEFAGLDLSGCELVVLSACDTGLGHLRAGQGIASLQRAFRMAGAGTVVSSLWRVSDEATLELMTTFYEGLWVRGLSPTEALWKAKQHLRAERGPLRDWAGWVLTGRP